MSYSRKLDISKFKFGVELEINDDWSTVKNKLKFDDGWHGHYEHCGSELVSPVLQGYTGLLSVRRQISSLHSYAKEGGRKSLGVNDAGLHVHVDIQSWTLGDAKNLILLARRFNNVMFSLMGPSRQKNQYTRQLRFSEDSLLECKTLGDIQALGGVGRYSCVNMYAFPKHGTVEFRYAGATIEWGEIYSLISLYLRMVAFAQSGMSIPSCELSPLKSGGPGWTKENKAALSLAKNILFDTLQISGQVRKILDAMFEANSNSTNPVRKRMSVYDKVSPLSLRSK